MSSLLNEKQLVAVEHVEGPLLVLAGAGSGKTRIVTHRVVHLLNLGVLASEILALTFTNKAADEMRYRIQELSRKFVLTCTFHSLAAKILRESIHEMGFNNHFTIYDEDDSLSLIRACLKTLGYEDEKSLVKMIKHTISSAKNALKAPHELDVSSFSSYEGKILKDTYSLYQQKLKEYNALDFDDLLFQCVYLLKTYPHVREHYQKRWSFVLIDEYQDTNEAQYILIQLLVEKHHNLFVVGDPDQSIYSWRGANIHNILNFEKDFPNAKVIKLEQNYRSTNHILAAANSLIQHNQSRYEKNLWSQLGDGEKVHLRSCENEHEEADFVAGKILHHQKNKVALDKMVIFYRTNAQSRVFEDILIREKIPYVIIGGISFYQRREIKDILALLRVVISETDFLSFSRTINLPKRGLGPTTLDKLKAYSEMHSLPIMAVCKKILAHEGFLEDVKLSPKQLSGLKEYLQLIDSIKKESQKNIPLHEIIKHTIECSRYLDYLKEDKETYEDRKSNLDELITKAAEWQEEDKYSLTTFLEELSLRSSNDEGHSMHGSIRLMTLHNGKGLEFEVSFIVGLDEELLPHINAKDSPEALEEERRLCYVGMTRAKRYLYMTSSKYRLIWGTPRIMQPSRFLQEIDPSHIQSHSCEEDESPKTSGEFLPGTPVLHQDFGRGIIKKNYNTSLGVTYDVFFPALNSTKSLVAKFAKLKAIGK
jgi:DNA helicase-2/ATP-dependent DNA helicase PcrA